MIHRYKNCSSRAHIFHFHSSADAWVSLSLSSPDRLSQCPGVTNITHKHDKWELSPAHAITSGLHSMKPQLNTWVADGSGAWAYLLTLVYIDDTQSRRVRPEATECCKTPDMAYLIKLIFYPFQNWGVQMPRQSVWRLSEVCHVLWIFFQDLFSWLLEKQALGFSKWRLFSFLSLRAGATPWHKQVQLNLSCKGDPSDALTAAEKPENALAQRAQTRTHRHSQWAYTSVSGTFSHFH